jgi:hypothetical protein
VERHSSYTTKGTSTNTGVENMNRKGMGLGKGMGYKNLIPNYDSHRHSMNAKGMRMPQKSPLFGGKNFKEVNEDVDSTFREVGDGKFEYKGFNIEISQDEYTESPREWDNLGEMAAFHKRYNLGDKVDFKSDQFESWEDMRQHIIKEKNAAVVLPIYIYDHSGLRMKVGSFQGLLPQGHAEFDSGQVGFTYVTKDAMEKESKFWTKEWKEKYHRGKSNVQIAEEILRGEVETYDQYLSGEVYQINVRDKDGGVNESVGGFYGYDYAKKEAKSIVDGMKKPQKYSMEHSIKGGKWSKEYMISQFERGRDVTFQNKAERDAFAKEMKNKGISIKKSSMAGQIMHPQYIADYEGEFQTGFGNTDYRTMFPTIYKVRRSR